MIFGAALDELALPSEFRAVAVDQTWTSTCVSPRSRLEDMESSPNARGPRSAERSESAISRASARDAFRDRRPGRWLEEDRVSRFVGRAMLAEVATMPLLPGRRGQPPCVQHARGVFARIAR